jgi:hypothetical protein
VAKLKVKDSQVPSWAKKPEVWALFFIGFWTLDFVIGLGWSAPHHGDTTDPVTAHLIARSWLPWSIKWYPFSFSGLDATSFTAFVPLDLLVFRWLPPWLADGTLVAIWACVGIGGGTLLGIKLGMEKKWAVLAGLCFTAPLVFEGNTQSWLALPFVLGVLGWPGSGFALHTAIAAATGLAFAVSTNIIMSIPFALGFFVFWILVFERSWTIKKLVGYIVFLGFAVGLNLKVLEAIYLVALGSHKMILPVVDLELQNLLGFLFGSIFLKLTTIFLVISVLLRWSMSPVTKRLLWGFAVLLALIVSGHILIQHYPDIFGVFRRLKLVRFDGGLSMFAIFATFGLINSRFKADATSSKIVGGNRWFRGSASEAAVTFTLLLLLLSNALFVKFVHARNWIISGSYNAIFDAPYASMLRDRTGSDSPARIVTIWSQSSFANAQNIESADGYTNMVPFRYYQLWQQIDNNEDASAAFTKMMKSDSEWGNRLTLKLDATSESSTTANFSRQFNLNILSLLNVRYVVSRKPLSHSDLKPVMSASQDWFSLSRLEKLKANLRENLFGQETFSIYENIQAFSRFRLVCDARVYNTDAELLAGISNADHSELARLAFLSRERTPGSESTSNKLAPIPSRSCDNSVTVSSSHPDVQVVLTKSDKPTYLIWSSSYSPWWLATIDGEKALAVPVNHALTGLYLPEGEHRVKFSYQPPF